MQLDLFATGIKCDLCNKDPGRGKNGNLWDGFLDMDSHQKVCNQCKKKHYQIKNESPLKNLYSEFPVVVNPHL